MGKHKSIVITLTNCAICTKLISPQNVTKSIFRCPECGNLLTLEEEKEEKEEKTVEFTPNMDLDDPTIH